MLLNLMELPEARKDLTRFSNIRWLSRNLGMRNSTHKYYRDAMNKIKYILRNNYDKGL